MERPQEPHRPRTWERLTLVALACLAALLASAQVVNEDALRKIELPAREGVIASLVELPGGVIAAAISTNGGVLLIDTGTWQVRRTIAVNGYHAGARLGTTADGRWLQLKELWRFTSDANKDVQGLQQVMDPATGAIVVDGGRAMDGALSADGRVFATLDGGTVVVRTVPEGTARARFTVAGATNAIAIDPRGEVIAVSHRPTEEQLLTVPSVRTDRKGMKAALKFRQMISFYSVDGRLLGTEPEIHDIVRALAWTADGSRVLVYSSADLRMQPHLGNSIQQLDLNMVDRPGRVEQIDASAMQPLRAAFSSLMNEPFLAVSPDGRTLALSSTDGHNKRKLTLYDTDSGDTRVLIDLEQKHRYDTRETEQHDGRLAYCWLSDGRLLVALGDNLGLYTP